MKKFTWMQLILLICLSSFAFAGDEEVDRSPVYHIYKDIDLIPTTKLEYDRPRIVIKAIVPKLTQEYGEEEDFAESIANYNDYVLELIDEEADAFREQVKANEEYQKSMAKSDIKNDFIIDFDSSLIKPDNEPVLSLRFAIHGVISGMSRSYRKHRVLNYDLANDQTIELADLFLPDSNYLVIIAQNARDILSRRLRDKSRIETGTMATAENFQNWNLTPYGLRITFNQEQVAPYIFGSQTITIPYSALSEVINPASILGKCLKKKRKCFGDKTMTGGFIDEAKNKSPVIASRH